jgi:hypothetical protein
MQAWVLLKKNIDRYCQVVDCLPEDLAYHEPRRHRAILHNACLVLAGPDPKSIADDPEAVATLNELKQVYDELEPVSDDDCEVSFKVIVILLTAIQEGHQNR